ncbi:MAG: hypothetical protein GWN56_01065, partial [Nitrosopumilaceae archaeon]|nr:hypothetical protein [Nitrosopumilaceae archaeon]NIV64755.1 hypothetical protein [Nitrosopumilaceae archaeon]
ALDPDEAGEKAGYQLSKEFKGYLIELGYDKDPDEILAAEGESKFEQIVKTAMEKPLYYLDLVIEQEEIKYALEYISKLEMESEKDLWLSKLASRRNVTIRSLRKDLSAITADYAAKEIFSKSNDDKHINPIDEYSEDEIKEAREIVESTNILDQVIKVTNESGYVGEERNKKLAYLACTSRKLPGKKKSISIITKGESGSGKSELVKHVLKLMPERDVKEFTFITEKALVHSKQDLSHKIVCVFERAGGENSDYTIRTAISEEKLSIFIPVKNKDTGDFESIEKEIPSEGIVYIETTTEENTEPQNANRTFEFFTDSSPELTRQVLLQQARGHIKTERKLEQKYRIWKCLQDLLEPLPVYVPFAEELAEQFPADKVRARRDYPRLLSLIETSAFIHQKNRDVIEIEGEKYIVASEEDFNTALEIISPILSQTYKELSPKEESLINIIIEEYGIGSFDHESAISPKDVNTFSPKELLDKIIVRIEDQKDKEARHFQAYSTLRNYIKNLSAKGVLEWNGGKGAKSKYALNSDIPKITFHISLSSLANTSNEEENSNDLSELQSESLAISQSSSYSESNLPKPLDNSDISSLAKENIEEENKEGADPWD